MIVQANQVGTQATIGSKARVLQRLHQQGFAVPEFVVVPAKTLVELQTGLFAESKLQTAITKQLPVATYAVRSAALVEDSTVTSQAGKFLTMLQVTPAGLLAAIKQVLADANTKGVATEQFSIIVQAYLAPEYAGVHFTVDPRGTYQTVTEYRAGSGAAVVGGEAVMRIVNSRQISAVTVNSNQTPFHPALHTAAINIEHIYNYPQDIEWVWHDGQLYIVQARPVTTITTHQWHGIQTLDKHLPANEVFFYAQDSLIEAFSQTTPLGFSFLQRVYAPGGPVELAYRSLGIVYGAYPQLVQFGNSVFINKIAELQNLYPALIYDGWRVRVVTVRKLWRTITNTLRLAFLKSNHIEDLQVSIKNILETDFPVAASLQERVDFFSTHYPCLFTVGIHYAQLYKRIEKVVGTELARKLVLQVGQIITPAKPSTQVQALVGQSVGNSLSFDDNSAFTINFVATTQLRTVSDIVSKLAPVSQWKQTMLIELCDQLQVVEELREQARWGSVRLRHYIQQGLGPEPKTDWLPFTTLEELLHKTVSSQIIGSRSQKFMEHKTTIFPITIASVPLPESTFGGFGVSSGVGTGEAITLDQLRSAPIGDYILLVPTLSPDLAPYLQKVAGIISQTGGVLSHLAILAREAQVPVVVSDKMPTVGSKVCMNGDTGNIDSLL
jgi:phosphoenolpyruvate synthase/pyruvate phosphate dikinase